MPLESSPSATVQNTAFNWHRQNTNVEEARLATAAAQEEWDGVATVEPMYRVSVQPASHISFQQALAYFQGRDLSEYMSSIQPEVEQRGLCTLLSCLMGPPQLEDHLVAERDLVFAIAQCKLDVTEAVHVRILQTVYYRFTGATLGCPCYGSHWEHIGFQGSDPGTDLRGVGMLGLLQLLYLSSTPQLSPLAKHIYRVSNDVIQNFPLAILSFNLTRMALQALRQGQLNRECNERQMVVDVLNEFYAAVFYHMVQIWTTQHKTIRDSGYVLKVEWFCRSNVRAVMRNLQSHIKSISPNDKFCFRESFHDLRTQAKTEVFI
ncbi:ELMO domain-containing protein 3 isoform X2 [Anabrus simplex]|uniref:ELMO domain-containing protein 3 isoform X2 n=1 Tax=Anabrus simplex TaxID=316456 RepID=UPI0034DCD770